MTYDQAAPTIFYDAARDASRIGNQPFHELPAALIPADCAPPLSARLKSLFKNLWTWAPWPAHGPHSTRSH